MAVKDEPLKDEEPKETPEKPGEDALEDDVLNEQATQMDSEKAESVSAEPEIGAVQEELANEKNRVLRLSAEFDNHKKRMSKEMNDFRRFANESLVKQLLTVVDNLERAIGSGEEENADVQSLLEGVRLTHREIVKILDTSQVKAVEALGKPFDPTFHQAVSQMENEEHPENTVITELQKGYLLHDRLIRPSMVVVSKAITINDKEEKK